MKVVDLIARVEYEGKILVSKLENGEWIYPCGRA